MTQHCPRGFRPTYRRLLTTLSLLVLPLPGLLACGGDLSAEEAAALLPLKGACQGAGVAEAADYDPANPTPTIAAIVVENDTTIANNRYLDAAISQGKTIQQSQLVLCVNLAERQKLETCRYGGPQSFEVDRFDRGAKVKLVAAKTGQIINQVDLKADPIECPSTIRTRRGSTPNEGPYTADYRLMEMIRGWSASAIAGAQPAASPAASP